MSDFSITVHLSPGIIAAFVFFIFEIVILPLTLFTTSKLAALALQKRLKDGNFIPVRSIIFPLYGEGLLNCQKSHWILLIVRIILVGIPVYLETRLKSRDLPIHQTTILPIAYEVSPKENWVTYANESDDSFSVLRKTGLQIARRCTSFDRDGWIVASVANVTFLKNMYVDTLSCVNGTEKRILRQVIQVPDHAEVSNIPSMPVIIRQNITLQVSISYGTVDSFSPSAETGFVSGYDAAFRVRNLTVLNKTKYNSALQCFSEKQLLVLWNISSTIIDVICQNVTGGIVDFQTPSFSPIDFSTQSTPSALENGTIYYVTALLNVTVMFLNGRVEFPGHAIFTGEHIVNRGPEVSGYISKLYTPAEFQRIIHKILYTKRENRTTVMRLESTEKVTDLDSVFLSVLITEILLVIAAAGAVHFIASFNLKLQDIPTNLNGLSECWARQSLPPDSKGRAYVNLMINEKCDSEMKFMLANTDGIADNNDNIFSYIGTPKSILTLWQSFQRCLRN